MQLLDQFISQIGKQPTDWTSQDAQIYLDYVKNSDDRTKRVKKMTTDQTVYE
jgi:hypothetical protein